MTKHAARAGQARTRLVPLIGLDVCLAHQGDVYVGLCPFHRVEISGFLVLEANG